MPLSLRISPERAEMVKKAAARTGKSKSAFILEAVEEKLGLIKGREQTVRELAGWMSHEEAEEIRRSVNIFNEVNKGDWD